MKNKILLFVVLSLIVSLAAYGQTNISRLVFGSGNFGTDPNPTADITGQNGEVITNYVNGSWTFGSANLSTSGTFASGAFSTSGNFLPTTVGTLTNGSSTYYWKGGYFAELFWKSTKLVDSSGNVTSGGKIVATDSARVQTSLLVNGKLTVTDSAWIKNNVVLGGTLNVQGASTLVGATSVTGKLVGLDSGRVQGNFVVNGTASFSNYVFGIDSFTTTAPADTVAVTGVTASSFAFVEFYNPPYSAIEDTVSHHAICLVSGAGTAQLAVTRAKAYSSNLSPAPATLKSGQHYRYFIKK